jgi:pimeloyl-ACP methyl ester carboxylesterase
MRGSGSRRLCAVAGAVVVAAMLAAAGHAAVFSPCHGSSGVLCATIPAPLDYSGATPGQVSLAVEELPATGTPRGTMLLVAGGPGQASAGVFDLAHQGQVWRALFPDYNLVAYDNRGTGGSGALSCPGPEPLGAVPPTAYAASCAASLGSARTFYDTAAHADDIETVRQALGADRLFLWGTSYGTKQALAYATLFPTHVERLLLDSVLPLEGPDPFGRSSLQAIPGAVASLCSGGACRAATPDPSGDVVRLATRLETTPVDLGPLGRLDGVAFLQLVVDADLNLGLRAELPAAVHAALAGNTAALKRLTLLDAWDLPTAPDDIDVPLFLATTCDDGGFPWSQSSAPGTRAGAARAAIGALPAGSTGPFGSWAAGLGTYTTCESWPAQPGSQRLAGGSLPDVPVLILSGDEDMRTPTANARAVAARFPQAQILVVPGVGHSVLTADTSFCSVRNVVVWLRGGSVGHCGRVTPLVAPLGPFASSLAAVGPIGRTGGRIGRTLGAVVRTVHESEAAWLAFNDRSGRGLYGGRIVPEGGLKYRLVDYSDVPGVAVSGTVSFQEMNESAASLRLDTGSLLVTGSAAAHGSVKITEPTVTGTLGGRRVSAHS